MSIYAALLLVSVTIHTSSKAPTYLNPNAYGLTQCSGVFVGPNLILTAAHCFEVARGKSWAKIDGQSYEVAVLKRDREADLALIRTVKPMNHVYAKFGKPVNVSEKVYTVNSMDGYEGSYNEGYVNNIVEEPTSFGTLTILHSASILPGASGSGLYNKNKELIGINVATYRNFAAAVDILEINRFLNIR